MLAAYLAGLCWTFATALRPTRVQNIDVGALLQQRTLLRQQKAFAEADALLDRARTEADTGERMALLAEAERVLVVRKLN